MATGKNEESMNILILASNPRKDLNLEGEIRELQEVIERARHRENLAVQVGWAVRPEDLQRLLLKYEPEIVHFCGHGTGKPGLVLQDETGLEKLVSTEALSNLFELCADWVQCVLLNACYSEVQADAMVQHINYAIGMNHEIRDDAAIAFATGFYQALGYKQPIEKAFKFGCNAIQLQIASNSTVRSALSAEKRKLEIANMVEKVVIPEHLKPKLRIKPGLRTSVDKSTSDARKKLLPSTKLDLQSYIDQALEQAIARRPAYSALKESLAEPNIQFNSPKKRRKCWLVGIFGVILTTVASVVTFSSFSPQTTEMTAKDFVVQGQDKQEEDDAREALKDNTHKLELEQNDSRAYYDRGKARFELGEYQKAIEDYTQALTLNQHDARAYYDRGKARFELGDQQGAIEDYQKAAELFQQQGDSKRYQEALDQLRRT